MIRQPERGSRNANVYRKGRVNETMFWTKAEFNQFIECVRDNPQSYTAFYVLYWTGIRVGELMALTMEDVDPQENTIRVNKSYQKLKEQDIITEPKTPKSNRIISIPEILKNCLEDYLGRLYGLEEDERIFLFTKSFLTHEMIRG